MNLNNMLNGGSHSIGFHAFHVNKILEQANLTYNGKNQKAVGRD